MATSHVQVLVEFTKKLPGISSLLGQILLLQGLCAFLLPFGNRVYFEDHKAMPAPSTHCLDTLDTKHKGASRSKE